MRKTDPNRRKQKNANKRISKNVTFRPQRFLAATMDSQPPSSRGAVETMPKRLKPPAVSPGNGSFVVSEWLNPCLVKAFQNGQMAKVQNPKQRVQPALLLPQEMKRGCWCPANEIRCIIGARLGSQVCRLMVFNKSNRGEGRKGLMGTREPLGRSAA